ncbi:unnamed protein product [Leuciscus chuanchicus]
MFTSQTTPLEWTGKRTEPTLAPEAELHYESDQGCEPTTSVDEGEVTMDNEGRLINSSEELATPTRFLLPPSPRNSASPPALPLPDVYSTVPSPWKPCYDVEPQVVLPPAASVREDSATPSPASDLFTPSQPIDLSLRLHRIPSSCRLPLGQSSYHFRHGLCGPSAALHPSTPTAAVGSSFPSVSPLSFITPSPPQPSGTLASLSTFVGTASPWPPVPAMSLDFLGSPSVPVGTSASSPLILPQLSSASIPSWLLPPPIGTGKMKLLSRPELFDFEGVSMVHYFTDNWEKVKNFQARPDDILIATYPKAGTTWVSYILDLLYFGKDAPERQTSLPIYMRVPFLESCFQVIQSGTELADNLPTSPRLIKTHLPVQLVPKSFWEQNSRIVYVARNAKDNAVSYFHFDRMNMGEPEPGDWNTFLQKFMEGKNVFGPWFDHVSGWWEKKQTYSNLLYLFYEDLVEDTGREVERLCSFLGLSTSVEEREKITKGVQFDAMKQNKMTNYSTLPVMDFKISPFMRKGKVGDWKGHFTVAQNEQFDEVYKQKMKNTTVKFRTEI